MNQSSENPETAGGKSAPCPYCSELIFDPNVELCPACLGLWKTHEPIREHAWRNQDDRQDLLAFKQWLRGDFTVEGLDEAPDRHSEDTSLPTDKTSPPRIEEPPAGDIGSEQSQHQTSGAEAPKPAEPWPPKFSPGLRINFKAERLQQQGSHDTTGGNLRNSSQRSPETRPPVLIIDGPGPVLFGGRPARSIVVPTDSIEIGRSTGEHPPDVDIDLCQYHGYDRLIARHHARIFSEGNVWFVEDLADNDATRIYGLQRPLNQQRAPLRNGDLILIGESIRIRFHERR